METPTNRQFDSKINSNLFSNDPQMHRVILLKNATRFDEQKNTTRTTQKNQTTAI